MCEAWSNSRKEFEDFCLANGWYDGCEIDRFPNRDGDYEPGNVRFVSSAVNIQNRACVKLNPEIVKLIKARRAAGWATTTIAKSLDLHQSTIWAVVSGEVWGHVVPDESTPYQEPVINKRTHRLRDDEIRSILHKYFVEGKTNKELTEEFQCSPCTISKTVSGKARQNLYHEFKAQHATT